MIDYTIPQEHVAEAFTKEWGGNSKAMFYAKSDGTNIKKASSDRLLGNLGEWAAYGAFTEMNFKCKTPNLETVKKPDQNIWPDDLWLDAPCNYKGKEILMHHSVKGQKASIGRDFGISWLWQLETEVRHIDPMLLDPNYNCLFIGVQIDNTVYSSSVSLPCKVSTFYWPDIFPYIKEPKKIHLQGQKKAIYLDDIAHLEIDYNDLIQETQLLV